jgi:hypothetical protein
VTPEDYGRLFFLIQMVSTAVLVIGGIVFVILLV